MVAVVVGCVCTVFGTLRRTFLGGTGSVFLSSWRRNVSRGTHFCLSCSRCCDDAASSSSAVAESLILHKYTVMRQHSWFVVVVVYFMLANGFRIFFLEGCIHDEGKLHLFMRTNCFHSKLTGNIEKEHVRSSLTSMTAPALSNCPQ